ncbi:MAG: exodeoxyribonuclease V subunit alpha [Actinomycetota bacterium]|nr:exodeoxyribonuclease V subunit alpha [Actinomycetota bacterium]
MSADVGADPFGAGIVVNTPPALQPFAVAGLLAPGDIHVARWVLAHHRDDVVALATAFTVRALRLGNVCLDVPRVRHTATVDATLPDAAAGGDRPSHAELPWPDVDVWLSRLQASEAVAVGDADPGRRPLRLVGHRLYLDRSWRQELAVAADLVRRTAVPAEGVDTALLSAGLARLYPGDAPDLQRLGAAAAVLRRCSVLAGGPGTGKTTTAARILALLDDQAAAAGLRPPRVALAAPTGKAAGRLQQSVNAEAATLDVGEDQRRRLAGVDASTLHRLLGRRPGPEGRFDHDRRNRLPHDVVVVDETSMVSLALLAALVDALRVDARLVLLGDPEQLASVEAGAVLADIVGPVTNGLVMSSASREALSRVTGQPVDAEEPPSGVGLGDGIVVLRRVHRFGVVIAALAEAIQAGDTDEAVHLLDGSHAELAWISDDGRGADERSGGHELSTIRHQVVEAGRAVLAAAGAGDGPSALESLATMRILCAHRRGPYGVTAWADRVDGWLIDALNDHRSQEAWYVGRPVLVTANDHELGLANGDVGVVIAHHNGERRVAFARHDEFVEVNPGRLRAFETVHAMTIHKSQGSQFNHVAVVLPEPGSPLLTRQLFYTAVTRARHHVTVVGSEAAVRTAVDTRISRASGLAERLWGAGAGGRGPDSEPSIGWG